MNRDKTKIKLHVMEREVWGYIHGHKEHSHKKHVHDIRIPNTTNNMFTKDMVRMVKKVEEIQILFSNKKKIFKK